MATAYQIQTARLALRHLVRAAQRRETLTYKGLGDEIGEHHRPLPRVLGHIRDDICRKKGFPIITALVVRDDTRLPGDEFLPEGSRGLTDAEFKRKFEEHRDAVFACERWDDLLADLGLSPIPKTFEDLNKEGKEYARLLERKGGAKEGEAHLRLKEYVSSNPGVVGLSTKRTGAIEFVFVSGDRCDVVFDLDEAGGAVVEVKNGNHDGELVKGVYQAVKYRALMAA